MKRLRFMMIGGFLGAGKTTAIARLARHYADRGLRVAIVTNDQAFGLVDTQSLRAKGFKVGEVTGACFCCKFNDLVSTVERLAEGERPDIVLAEPVGSCTDLVATVVEPLKHLYQDRFETAPVVVLLKPEHGQKILGDDPACGFSPKAAYIFLKQIEEADMVAVNKLDKLSPADAESLLAVVRRRFPDKRVVGVSARSGDGFQAIIETLDAPAPIRTRTPEVDYDIYAEGEAELGWLNCEARLIRPAGIDSNVQVSLDELVLTLVRRLSQALAKAGAEPAHLKIMGTSGDDNAIANLVASSDGAELSLVSGAKVTDVDLTINARVAIAPEELVTIVERVVAVVASLHTLRFEISNMQSFRPGRPVPTHRMALGQV